jgi:hypothetical protein
MHNAVGGVPFVIRVVVAFLVTKERPADAQVIHLHLLSRDLAVELGGELRVPVEPKTGGVVEGDFATKERRPVFRRLRCKGDPSAPQPASAVSAVAFPWVRKPATIQRVRPCHPCLCL